MENTHQSDQFKNEVYAAELEEVAIRRGNCKNEEPKASLETKFTVKNGLSGLACSGGGIRSASFSLGVIQYLISHGLLEKIDYLSTVSGGGYIGSCISSLGKDKLDNTRLLTDRKGQKEPEALNHIRNYSEYLKASGSLNRIRLPILFIEGVIRSILIFLPTVILATLLTEAFFEITGTINVAYQWFTPLVGLAPLIVSLLLRPVFKHHHGWEGRDRADARLAIYAAIAAISIIAVPVFACLREIVHHDAATLMAAIGLWKDFHLGYVFISTFLLGGAFIIGCIKLRGKVLVAIAGIIAPASLIILYIVLCVEVINSPFSYANSKLSSQDGISSNNYDHSRLIDILLNQDSSKEEIDCSFRSEIDLQLCDYLRSIFRQKNLFLDDYIITSRAPREISLTRRHSQYTSSMQEIQTWLLRYFTTHKSPFIDIMVVPEIGTEGLLIKIEQLRLFGGHAEWWLYFIGLVIQIYNWLFININRFSLHPFYRDRLSRTFLVTQSNGELKSADTLKLSSLCGIRSQAPYHIINTALNLQGSSDPQLRARKSVPFVLSKRYCGSDFTGYCKTKDMEEIDPHLNLGTAVAISAAAASPNMGTSTIKSLSFLLTLLNVRLNYWLPHPGKLNSSYWKRTFKIKPLGLSYLLKEAFGLVSERTPFINCSDGGHIENLAMYELLRRQCKTIICIDAEADPNFDFTGLVTLQRYAEIDLGIRLDIDVKAIKPVKGLSSTSYSEGKIYYANGEIGRLLYLKLSFKGNEPEYLHHYRRLNPDYPHQATSDQYFDETQFEVYRALGFGVAETSAPNLISALNGE